MFTFLINLGLAIIPFFFWVGCDTRQPKMTLALVLSLALSLYAFYKGNFKPYKNKWILFLLAYIPFNYILTPKLSLTLFDVQPGTFWIMESFVYVLIFFLAHAAIASYEYKKEDVRLMLNIISWVGLLMSLLTVTQFFGFEQIFIFKKTYKEVGRLGGSLGTPSILSAFLAMVIPIQIYMKKYYMATLAFIVVLLTTSQVAIGASILSLMFLIGTKNKALRILMIALFLAGTSILTIGYFKSERIKSFVKDNGRFTTWSRVVEDLKSPIPKSKEKFALTGFGLGSFKYIYHARHTEFSEEAFREAHNDYIQLLHDTGIIGLSLFLTAIGFFIKQAFPLNRFKAHLMASFICVAICAGGFFPWQLAPIIFYTLVITGLLIREGSNEEIAV